MYDSANQLLRENNQKYGYTHTWTYDIFGNITSRKEYPYTTGALGTPTDTITYTYEEEYCWGDRLIGYDGQEIELDEIGNTIYDGTWDYLWRNGRELFFMTNYEKEWFFEYDVNGMRTERSDYEDITYQYVYNGSSLSQMTVGNNTLYFAYGANGAPISVDYNGTTYYYVTNIQGDVIAILDDMGTVVVNYSYDAWGNHLSISGYMSNTLGTLNPLRYRGYVYDQETNLYYLQSRYYNPEWGRWLSAEPNVYSGKFDEGSGLIGYNVFAYCANNPVNYIDILGEDAIWLQDKNSVLGFGHTGLLLQDKNGTWHHFYWGNIGTGRKGKRGVTGNLISLGHFSYSNLSLMNNYLNENSIYNGKYEGAIYFEGDFSASVDYAKNLNKNYHLLWDNCMQISVEVLLKGKFEQSNIQYKIFLNKISLNPIPNLAYNRLQSLHNTITQYHSVPWYRKIFRMNPLEAVLLL